MISISRLLCDNAGPGDHLRYGQNSTSHNKDDKGDEHVPRPVVVWNCTRQCNLKCIHCYANASMSKDREALGTTDGYKLIRNLAEFGVPAILFSGGEPLLRKDVFELARYAVSQNIRISLSTNGTLISADTARLIRDIGFSEVGISLDGIGLVNDRFRGVEGAFEKALEGIRNCVAQGIRVSLRLTMTAYNCEEITAIFALAEKENIERICFYHLAYSGRGKTLQQYDVSRQKTRMVIDDICKHTVDLYNRGLPKEVLTVGNHADGVYIYQKLMRQKPVDAGRVHSLLSVNGGNNSGIRISSIDEAGNVHPDQFWQHYSLGNVKSRNFSEIWSDATEPLLAKLRNRKPLLMGKCGRCKHIDLCNGNLRVRAESFYDNLWAEDPACYLDEEEIAL